MESLENTLNKLEAKSKELNEVVIKNKEEIRILEEIATLQNRIRHIEKEIQELNQPKLYNKISQLLTYIHIEPKTNQDSESHQCKIDIGHDGRKATPHPIPTDLVKKMLGEDLAPFIGKRIPVLAYRYKSEVIEFTLREENVPLDGPKRKGLQKAGEISKLDCLLNKLKSGYSSKLQETKKNLERIQEAKPSKSLESLQIQQSTLSNAINYINAIININQPNILTSVKGKIINFPQEQIYWGYCLCFGDEPVGKWLDRDWYNFIFSKSKTQPMKTVSIKKDLGLEKIMEVVGIKVNPGDYFSLDLGYRIFNTQKIEEIFTKVENGIEIFPSPKKPWGIRVKETKGDSQKRPAPQPRHWGQEYIKRFTTGDIIEGEFFATGFSYQAFPVHNLIVVEPNKENRATYIFDKEKFEYLRFLPRAKIILEKPEGYRGRIIHENNKKNWQTSLQEILSH